MQIESLYFPTCCAMNGKIIGISEADMTMLERMKEISKLKDNWNQNGATAFSKTLLTKVENILLGLEFQPEIFPTACITSMHREENDIRVCQ